MIRKGGFVCECQTRLAETVVATICQQYKIHPVEFFGKGRDNRAVRARRAAIKLLVEAGFNKADMARAMKRDYATIRYWTVPGVRTRKRVCFIRTNNKRAA